VTDEPLTDARLDEIERAARFALSDPDGLASYSAASSVYVVPELVAEVRRLRQLIIEYARHTEGCSAAHGDQYRCRCGWRDVEAGFK
jgi:hypothetical protein